MLKTVRILGFILICTTLFMQADNIPAQSISQLIKENTSGGINIRLRNELWNTFETQGTDTDNTYNFFLTRVRPFLEYSSQNFTVHVKGQGVKAFGLPDNGAFGAGPIYFGASGQDSSPGNLQLLEAYIHLKNLNGLYVKGGRIGLKEGAEVLYKDSPKLNWLIKKRLSERLIGNLDWTNVGRRFDGATGGYNNNVFDLNIFGANPTFGAFDFDDGLEKDLDRVVVAGGTFTLKKDVLLKDTQFKIFNYYYFDNREPAIAFAGDDLKINTTGISVAGAHKVGTGELDFLLWLAFQFGDFGDEDQKALAFIAETGYQFTESHLKPWLRLGIAFASGDDDPDDSDNSTFFNYLPTNHKYYGYVDANAFSNLVNAYFQLFLTLHSKVNLAVDGHLFWLASDDEFQVGGSGAFNDSVFGYVFRQPIAGEDVEKFLGGEIDLTLGYNPVEHLAFKLGYSHFFGDRGIEVIFDEEDQLDWFYVQAVVNFNF